MRVLYTFGGISHYLDALLNKQQEKGAGIVTVIPEKGNATIGKGVHMVEGGRYKRVYAAEKNMFYGKCAFPALPQIVSDEKPDIVVMGWPYFLQFFFQPKLRKAIKKSGAKLVIREIPFQTPPYGRIRPYFEEHAMYDENMNLLSKGAGFYIRQYITMHIRRYCYARAAGTLNYSSVAYDILPSYGVKKENIHVTYNATDTEALLKERDHVRSGKPLLPVCNKRILHIGRLVKWKRVDLLIDAFKKIVPEFPDAELVIVGDGPELDNLKRQAEESGFGEQIRFTGSIYKPQELGAYMNESTLYVLAGMGGLSINDAMTYGMPVICSVCDGTEKDLVTDGRNGFFFKEGDADSLAEKIKTIFASPELRADMQKESERIIREKINLESVSDRFLEAFTTILKQQ